MLIKLTYKNSAWQTVSAIHEIIFVVSFIHDRQMERLKPYMLRKEK
jgi:hypothetical protein